MPTPKISILTLISILCVILLGIFTPITSVHANDLDDLDVVNAKLNKDNTDQNATKTSNSSSQTDEKTPPPKNLPSRRLEGLVNIQPTAITVEAPRGDDVEDKLIIYENENGEPTLALTPKQMCDVCHSTIDTGITLLRRGIALNQQPKDVRAKLADAYGMKFLSQAHYSEDKDTLDKLIWDSEAMADEICEHAMGHFKPQYTLTCHDIIANYHDVIFKPFNHRDLFQQLINDTIVLEHKLDFCYKNKMCVTGIGLVEEQRPCTQNTPVKRTRCESCLELAGDSRMMFRRLMTTIPNPDNNQRLKDGCTMSESNFNGFKNVWCDSLPLRHFRPSELQGECRRMIENDSISKKLYNVVRDGNNLHKLLKNATIWEETLCVKVSGACTNDSMQELYHTWDQSADFDYNITQARYLLDQHLSGHQRQLEELEEEYFYTTKHMFAPDPRTMSEDEQLEYKEFRKKADQINKIEQDGDEFDLDEGNDVDDDEDARANLPRGMSINDPTQENQDGEKEDKKTDGEEEESTELSPELEKRLLGRLAYVDEKGVRVPNELPPHVLREYKAKRHQLIHSVKHTSTIERYQKQLDELKEEAKSYEGKRRVWALPDSMLVSKRMDAILTRILNLKAARAKGKAAEQAIQDEYDAQLRQMQQFSANFSAHNIDKTFDIDLDEDIGLDLRDAQYQDPEIDNEAEQVVQNENNNNKKQQQPDKKNDKKKSIKDEL